MIPVRLLSVLVEVGEFQVSLVPVLSCRKLVALWDVSENMTLRMVCPHGRVLLVDENPEEKQLEILGCDPNMKMGEEEEACLSVKIQINCSTEVVIPEPFVLSLDAADTFLLT